MFFVADCGRKDFYLQKSQMGVRPLQGDVKKSDDGYARMYGLRYQKIYFKFVQVQKNEMEWLLHTILRFYVCRMRLEGK